MATSVPSPASSCARWLFYVSGTHTLSAWHTGLTTPSTSNSPTSPPPAPGLVARRSTRGERARTVFAAVDASINTDAAARSAGGGAVANPPDPPGRPDRSGSTTRADGAPTTGPNTSMSLTHRDARRPM